MWWAEVIRSLLCGAGLPLGNDRSYTLPFLSPNTPVPENVSMTTATKRAKSQDNAELVLSALCNVMSGPITSDSGPTTRLDFHRQLFKPLISAFGE